MGACNFDDVGEGRTPQEAFDGLREAALHEYGHNGYTGTIAEKNIFVMFPEEPTETAAFEEADRLIDDGDKRIGDKRGPAGCIPFGPIKNGVRKYLFFGWAPE